MTSSIWCVKGQGPGLVIPEGEDAIIYDYNTDNSRTPCQCYEYILAAAGSEVLIYCHDDLTIHEPHWHTRIMEVFLDNPDVVAVGLGGATGLGNRDLYRKPYDIRNMARTGYASNQTDAEVHGERFNRSRRVAVLDAFCMAVRADFLQQVGGWPVAHLTHHGLDLFLACEAARRGKEIWIVGAHCTHHGGGTSTKAAYQAAKWLQGGTPSQDHAAPHVWLWDTYRDVLPIKVT